MPKQPTERRHNRNRSNRPTSVPDISAGQSNLSQAATLNESVSSPRPSEPVPLSQAQAGWRSRSRAEADQRRQDDLQRLTRSPLLPSRFSFMSPDLVLRGFGLGTLLFSFIGTLALVQPQ